jgi:hypothetical protein
MRRLLLASIFGLLLLAPPALAADNIHVHLKSGAEYQGLLVEKIPGDHLTLQLTTGEVKRFEWAEIATDAPDAAAPPMFQPSGTSSPSPPPLAPDTSHMAFVHIDAKNPDDHPELRHVAMSVDYAGRGGSLAVGTCMAPCDQWVPSGEYYIGGRRLESSAHFDLLPGESSRLLVNGGSSAGWVGGIFLTSFGATATAIGLYVFYTGAQKAWPNHSECTLESGTYYCAVGAPNAITNNPGLEAAGIVTTLVAGGLTALGIWVWSHNRTTVDKQSGATQALDHQRLLDALSGTIRF